MKFLQVHYFYEEFLRQLYLDTPALKNAPFNKQIEVLQTSGFYAPQIWGPHLEKLGYESYLTVCNCMSAQHQWAREHNFAVPPGKDWRFEIVRRQIDVIKPDILFLTLPTWYDSVFLRSLTWQPRIVLAWRAASITKELDWSRIDVFLSQLSNCRKKALELGARNVEHFFPGFAASLLERSTTETVEPHDVMFSGSFTREFTRRNRFLHAAAQYMSGQTGTYSAAFYINVKDESLLTPEIARFARPPLWGITMYDAIKNSRIVLNGEIDLSGGEAGNMRLFEVTGCGSFLLTQHHDNIRDYFIPGVEIETYKTSRELVDKIDYYITHTHEREQIARRGQQRCLKDYTMKKRAVAMDRLIKKYLN